MKMMDSKKDHIMAKMMVVVEVANSMYHEIMILVLKMLIWVEFEDTISNYRFEMILCCCQIEMKRRRNDDFRSLIWYFECCVQSH